jgi:dTDP-4-dehydrorhamnose 3,5-epimerase
MKFTSTPVEGAVLVDLELIGDERGFFAIAFSDDEFKAEGLEDRFVQAKTSLSEQQGTLRGLHYQLAPSEEVKLVRCIRGVVWDVVLDLRPQSSTFGRWYGAELSAENRRAFYIPRGCAHGFLTLSSHAEIFYFVSAHYDPVQERGVRWDDPRFGIEWPGTPVVVSDRDRTHPDF